MLRTSNSIGQYSEIRAYEHCNEQHAFANPKKLRTSESDTIRYCLLILLIILMFININMQHY